MASLDEIAELKPGWDGYGAPSISPQAIEHARRAGEALKAAGFPVEYVPINNGCVGIEWHTLDHDASLEIGGTRAVGYIEAAT